MIILKFELKKYLYHDNSLKIYHLISGSNYGHVSTNITSINMLCNLCISL